MNTQPIKILVTGASGHLGRATIQLLLGAGPQVEVIAATRDPVRLSSLAAQGVAVRQADFDHPETLPAAFSGIDAALIISTDQLSVPGARQRQHQAALDATVAAGVKHIVYTSMPAPSLDSPIVFAPDHLAMELGIVNSKVPYTILRNSWYAEDLLFILPQVLATGKWYTCARQGRIPYVARHDTARAAAAALLSGPANLALDISGPELLMVDDIAAIASDVFEKPISVIQVDSHALAGHLAAQGVSDFYVPMAVMTDVNQAAGNFDVVSTAFRDLVGQAPQSLKQFFIENKSKFLPA